MTWGNIVLIEILVIRIDRHLQKERDRRCSRFKLVLRRVFGYGICQASRRVGITVTYIDEGLARLPATEISVNDSFNIEMLNSLI